MSVLCDQYDIPLTNNNFFEYDLINFELMSIDALKETATKWGVTISAEPIIKDDLIYTLTGVEFNEARYNSCRIKIELLNGKSMWYEVLMPYWHATFKRSGKSDSFIEYYTVSIWSSSEPTFVRISYDKIKNKWYQWDFFEDAEILDKSPLGPGIESCLRDTRNALMYLEKRYAYENSILFEEFLNKDIIGHIRSFL